MKMFSVMLTRLPLALLALGMAFVSCDNGSGGPGNNTEVTYTVSFSANDGSGEAPNAMPVQAGSSITLPDEGSLTRDGYEFGGWNTDAGGTGTNYNVGSSYTPTGTITLYATWIEVNVSASGMELLRVPDGSFQMGNSDSFTGGNDDERPVHQVTLSGFYMGKYEVTQAQYQEVMGALPNNLSSSSSNYGKGDDYPVYYVSWYNAVEFCNRLSEMDGLDPVYTITSVTVTRDQSANGYRLPTEAEWEYACRAGTTTAYNTGASIMTSQANYNYAVGSTKVVGSYAPNAWGLYDMHGNISEWCWDWYETYQSTEQTDPTGPDSGSVRVQRGGCWYDSEENVRSEGRKYFYPFYGFDAFGFRVARN